MLFSSTIFLFAFLPLVLLAYLVMPRTAARNGLLLCASLFFYAWGETLYLGVLIGSIALNYGFGLWVAATRSGGRGPLPLAAAVASNLLILAGFKYANFFAGNLDALGALLGWPPIDLAPVHLPIGISFFTFQAITYVVDVHRGVTPAQRSPLRLALYIALFPQLIAGPIVRYGQVARQLDERDPDVEDRAEGIRRFAVGLIKKVLVANTLAVPADAIFALAPGDLEPAVAWFGLLCYALQIYFDFAGYSDMAIGLGRYFGFRFPENFDWPYLARSVREFWRRWHLSLSAFFRDYLYVPLGGNRRGRTRTHLNLLVVFFLCGLWHGASWNFVIWGLLHGALLVAERTAFGDWIARLPRPLAQGYVLLSVMLAWVFFRAEDLSKALDYMNALFGLAEPARGHHPLALYANTKVVFTLSIAVLCALPMTQRTISRISSAIDAPAPALRALRLVALHLFVALAGMSLAAGTHNPFIYFRF